MTEPTAVPTLAQCPACGHETLTTEPTGWRAIGPRLTCTSEDCEYSHDIPALPPARATIPASQLRPGHSILGRNAHGITSTTVTGAHRDGDTVTVYTRLGDREYRHDERIEVDD